MFAGADFRAEGPILSAGEQARMVLDAPAAARSMRMLMIVDGLLPVAMMIATGWGLHRFGLVSGPQWQGVERVSYYVFFPAIVIETLARARLEPSSIAGIGTALVGAILITALFLILSRPFLQRQLHVDGPAFTSLFQGATRWNTFVALALAAAMFGEQGLSLMAIAVAAMIPLLNVLAVTVLARWGHADTPRPTSALGTLFALVRNPFIWSCVIGIALNLAGAKPPAFVMSFAHALGAAALGAGLLVVGAGLDLSRLARPRAVHMLAVALKLALMPLLATSLARISGVGGIELTIVAIASAVPTASASYILARQYGGDAPLMSEILTLQTLMALITLPLMVVLLGTGYG
jgi:predicted permease